ncbi:MAG: hypothetical protein EXQ85_08090 [Alphaproteobacteria bacterium]|nr:hypothetical protein [Alphaproteobacteria bacterium]
MHTPPELLAHCSESLVLLPDSFMAAGPSPIDAASPSRAGEGLPPEGLVLANFNAHYKFDPATFAVWMALLRETPASVLWLRAGLDAAMDNLRRAAEADGVAAERLIFAPRREHPRHLARHRLADLALDCRFHTGGVTTTDALWAGVPVLTLAGPSHSERTGASILTAIGLGDLIATDLADYQHRATALIGDDTGRRAVRDRLGRLRETAPLFQPDRLARHLEDPYRLLWRARCSGERPKVVPVPRRL